MFSLGNELPANKTVRSLKTQLIFSGRPHNYFMARGKSHQYQALQSQSIQYPVREAQPVFVYSFSG